MQSRGTTGQHGDRHRVTCRRPAPGGKNPSATEALTGSRYGRPPSCPRAATSAVRHRLEQRSFPGKRSLHHPSYGSESALTVTSRRRTHSSCRPHARTPFGSSTEPAERVRDILLRRPRRRLLSSQPVGVTGERPSAASLPDPRNWTTCRQPGKPFEVPWSESPDAGRRALSCASSRPLRPAHG